jgi:hypothetical protein
MARGIVEFNDGMTVVPGSHLEKDINDAIKLQNNNQLARAPYSKGVFSEFPSATPKWLGRKGAHSVDFRETMARMFILLDANERARFLASVDASHHGGGMGDQGESRILASVLAGRDKGEGRGYIDFLLQQVDHGFQEKSQIVETLADNYVIYYFGQAAIPFTYSGTVLNTYEDDQAINMLRIYRDMIRGTQLARRRKLLRIRYNGMIVAGSVMSLNLGLSADPETSMSFSLTLMPKVVQLLPNPDFGVVQVHEQVGVDKYFLTQEDVPTNVRAGSPLAAPPGVPPPTPAAVLSEATPGSSGETVGDGGEDEAGA